MRSVVISGVGRLRPEPTATHNEAPSAGSGAHRVQFDPVSLLGRKFTRYRHRATQLAAVACEMALKDAGLKIDDENRLSVGITIGTTVGSFASTVDFCMDTHTQARPYLVDAASFPNTVLNATAAGLAIRTGIRGANATVAAGPLAGIAALRQAQVSLNAGHVGVVVAGAVEEQTLDEAWWHASAGHEGVRGEGAAMFVMEHRQTAALAGRSARAELLAAVVRAGDTIDSRFLVRTLETAMRISRSDPRDLISVHARRTGSDDVDRAQIAALSAVTRRAPQWDEEVLGDCLSAHAALQTAQLVESLSDGQGRSRSTGLVLAVDPAGAVGVAVLRAGRAEEES